MTRIRAITALVCVSIWAALLLPSQRGIGAEKREAKGVRVGTFDSRAIVVAYAHSKLFDGYMRPLMEEHKKAKAAGDTKRAAELEAEGEAQQDLFHKQGFSTWPVNDMLEHVKDKLAAVAEQAGVDVIVSKWDITYQKPSVEYVDVTDALVALFEPKDKLAKERALKTIQDMRSKPPIPLKDLQKMLKEHPH